MPQTKHFRSTVSLADHIAKEGSLPSEVLVLPAGKWNTLPYGVMEVSEASIDQMIANFESGVRKDVPIDVDHDGKKAAGWVKKLKKKAEGMVAEIDWTPYGSELLNNKEYKLFSPEWSFEYLDPLTSAAHGATFIAGTLTNRPLFKQLPKLVANEQSSLTKDSEIVLVLAGEQLMNLQDLLKKPVADLTAEEKAFIAEHQVELTEEQKTTYKEVITPVETEEKAESEATDESTETETTEEKTGEGEASDETETSETSESSEDTSSTDDSSGDTSTTDSTEPIKADDKSGAEQSVTITASELARFKALEEQAVKTAAEKKIAPFMASEKGGKFLPQHKALWASFYLSCSEAQQTQLVDLLEKLPEHKIAGQISDTSSESLPTDEAIDLKVKALIAKEPKLDYAGALKRVLASDPALAEAYAAGV